MPPPPPPSNRNRANPAAPPPPPAAPIQPVAPAPYQPRRAPMQNDPFGVGVAPAPKGSARLAPLAIVAMALGIVGLLISFIGGGILGIAAIVVGIIGISQMNKNPLKLGGKAFAWIGIGTGIASILATAYFLIGAGAIRGLNDGKHQSACARNLMGILKSANVYANDNNDDFPLVLPPASATVNFGGGSAGGSSADLTISYFYTRATSRGNVHTNFYLLILKGYCAPKQFVCPGDPIGATPTAGNLTGFSGVQNFSYSAALPWDASGNKLGLWRAVVDASLPLMADIAPHNGDAVSGGTVEVNKIQANTNLWISGNHVGGQIVGWSDAHTSFEKRPDIGFQNDNIYTTSGGTGPSATGRPPVYGTGTSAGAMSRSISNYPFGGGSQSWDVYMVPSRGTDGKTY